MRVIYKVTALLTPWRDFDSPGVRSPVSPLFCSAKWRDSEIAWRAVSSNNGSMRLRSTWAAVFLPLMFLGCGDPAAETVEMANGNGGASGVAGSNGPVGGGGTAGASGGTSGGVGSAGATMSAPAMACSAYADESGYQLVVHIENKMSRTLYLGQDEKSCEPQRLFQVADGARQVLASLDGCHTSCDQMMTSGPVACPLACATPSTVELGPNQSLQIPWDGRFAVTQSLPGSCLKTPQAEAATCVQASHIEPAIFTFSARAGSARQCLSGTCSCTPNQAGGCVSANSLISGTIYTSEFVIKLEPGEAPYIGVVFNDTAK